MEVPLTPLELARPARRLYADRAGWFHSGDAAVVHADCYLEIRDRFKDVIISGGENISSVEVEGVMMRQDEHKRQLADSVFTASPGNLSAADGRTNFARSVRR